MRLKVQKDFWKVFNEQKSLKTSKKNNKKRKLIHFNWHFLDVFKVIQENHWQSWVN